MSGKVLRPECWPEDDRLSWAAAFEEGDIFDGRGPAAHWSGGSRRSIASGYGRWIGYLTTRHPEALSLAPANRVTRDRLRRYLEHLADEITPAGIFNYAKHLYDAIRAMSPEHDWRWLKSIVWRLPGRGLPRGGKSERMVSVIRLIDLGLGLMDWARPDSDALQETIAYRDGLIIALLICRPIRRRSLAAMRLGRHLVKVGGRWHLVFRADETKTHRPYEAPLPDFLAPFLEHYLNVIRPRFPKAFDHDGVWASSKGCPLSESALYHRVAKRTQAAFGRPINLHLFRDIAVTEIAYLDPVNIGMAPDLLSHGDQRSVDRHYNQSSQIRAGRAFADAVLAERSDLNQTGGKTSRRR